jgi:hypothetical protein
MQTMLALRGRPLLNAFGASLLMALCAACGGGGGSPLSAGAPVSSGPVSPVPPPVSTPSLAILAGDAAEAGSVDGSGTAARFQGPVAMTIDSAGNLIVPGSCSLRKITPAGVVSTVAGTTDGCAPSGTSVFPLAIALAAAADGRLFLTRENTVVEVSPVYVTQKFAVLEAGPSDSRSAIMFSGSGIAVDVTGNVIVANSIGTRRITPSGATTMLEGVANTDTSSIGTQTLRRRGVAVDANGTVYLAAIDNTIVRIDASGKTTVVAGTPDTYGTSDGTGAAARFGRVVALAVDGQGNLYAADSGYPTSDGNGGSMYNELIRKITPAGVVTTIAGKPSATPSVLQTGALPGSLAPLGGIALDGKGNLYASSGTAIIKIVLP